MGRSGQCAPVAHLSKISELKLGVPLASETDMNEIGTPENGGGTCTFPRTPAPLTRCPTVASLRFGAPAEK